MPEIVRWFAENPVRWVVPAVFLLAVVGIPVALWWEKRRPSVPAHVAEMAAWRRLSTEEQAAVDAEALAEGLVAGGFDAAVRARAEESARLAAQLAAQRAAEINVQYHP